MTTTHSIGEILSAGAIPTAEETEHLCAIGKFVASHFGRFVGLSRGDFIRERAWEPKWLSAMTGVRWSIGMGLGSDLLGFSRHAFGQLLAPGYDSFAADRALVDPYDEDFSVEMASEGADVGVLQRAFAAREGLFGGPRAPRASHGRRSRLASTSGVHARSLDQAGASRVVWADGAFADVSVARALVSQGVLLADQVAAVESFVGAKEKERDTGRGFGHARPSLSPASADKRALSLDGMRVDDRTPGLASALRVADRVATRSSRAVAISGLGAEQGFAPPRVYGFYDAVSGAFVSLEAAESSFLTSSAFQPPGMGRGVRARSSAPGIGAMGLASRAPALPGRAVDVAALSSAKAASTGHGAVPTGSPESHLSLGLERAVSVPGQHFSRVRLARVVGGGVGAEVMGGRSGEATRRGGSGPVELSLVELVRDVSTPEGALRVFSGFESDRRGSSAGVGAGGDRSLKPGRLARFAEATSYLPSGDVVARVERAQMASPRVRLLLALPGAVTLPPAEEGFRPSRHVPSAVDELVSALTGRHSVSGWERQPTGGGSSERAGYSANVSSGTGTEQETRASWAPWTAEIGLDGERALPVGRALSVPEINGGSLFLKAMDGGARRTSAEAFRPLVAGGSGEVTNVGGWERALDGWTWITLAGDTQSLGVASSSRNLLATLARGVQVPASLALAASTRVSGTRYAAAERSTGREVHPAGVGAASGGRGAAAGDEMSGSDADARSASAGATYGRRVVDFVSARTGVLGRSRGTSGEALLPALAESGRRGANVPMEQPAASRPRVSALELRAVVGSGVERSGVGRLGAEQLLLVAAAQVAEVGEQRVAILRHTARGDAFRVRTDSAKGDVGRGAEFLGANIDGAGGGGARAGIAGAIRSGYRIMRGLEAVGLGEGMAAEYPSAEVFWRALGSLNARGTRGASGGGDSFSESVGLDKAPSRLEPQAVPHGRATRASAGPDGGGQWKSSRWTASTSGVGRASEVDGQQAFASYGARTLEWVLSGTDGADSESVAAARSMSASAVVRQMVVGSGVAGSWGGGALLRADEERVLGAASDAVRGVLERPVMTPREGRLLGGVWGGDGAVARVVARLAASAGRVSLEPSLAAFVSGRGQEMARGGAVRDWGGHGSPIALLGGISRLGREERGLVGRALSSAGWSSSTLELLGLADGVIAPEGVEGGGKGRDESVMRTPRMASQAISHGGLNVRSGVRLGDGRDSQGRGASAAAGGRKLTPDDGRVVRVEEVAAGDSDGFARAMPGVTGVEDGGYAWPRAAVVRERVLKNLARVIAGAESVGGRVDGNIGARTAEVSARLMAPAPLGILETTAEGYFGANAPSVARGTTHSAAPIAGRLRAELSDLVHVAVADVDALDLERARGGDNWGAVSARAAAGHRILSVAKALSQLEGASLASRGSRFDVPGGTAERKGVLDLKGGAGKPVVDSAGLEGAAQNEPFLGAEGVVGAVLATSGGMAARNALETSSSAPFTAQRVRVGRGGTERAKQLGEAVGELVEAPFDLSEVLSSALGLTGLSGRLARALSASTEGPGGVRRLLRPLGTVAPDVRGITAADGRDLLGWQGLADSVGSDFGGSAGSGGRGTAVAAEGMPVWAGMEREFVQVHADGDARESGASAGSRSAGAQAMANAKRGVPAESVSIGRGANIRGVELAAEAGSMRRTSPGSAVKFWGPAHLMAAGAKPADGTRGAGRKWSGDAVFALLEGEGNDGRPVAGRDASDRSRIAPWRAAAVAEEAARAGSARLETVLAPEAMLGGMRSFGVSAAMAALRSRVALVGQDGVGVLATLADSGIDLAAARSFFSVERSVRREGSGDRFGQLRGPQGARLDVRWIGGGGKARARGPEGEFSDRGVGPAFEHAGLSGAGLERGAGGLSAGAQGTAERASGGEERRRARVSRGQAAAFGRFDGHEVGEMVAGGDGLAARRFVAHEIIERAGGRTRAQRAGLLSAILRGAERSEVASVLGSFGLGEFTRAWSGRVDGSRAGLVDVRANHATGDRGVFSGARRESSSAGSSPLRGASFVETAPSRAAGGVGAGGGRAGASEAVRRTDWRFVETGSRASTAHADLGRLAAAIVSSAEAPSRVPMPLVAPAAKAVAQTALRAARSDANTQSRSASAGRGGGASGASAEAGGSVQLSEKAIEMLAVEMASRVARLMGMMKERVGIW